MNKSYVHDGFEGFDGHPDDGDENDEKVDIEGTEEEIDEPLASIVFDVRDDGVGLELEVNNTDPNTYKKIARLIWMLTTGQHNDMIFHALKRAQEPDCDPGCKVIVDELNKLTSNQINKTVGDRVVVSPRSLFEHAQPTHFRPLGG